MAEITRSEADRIVVRLTQEEKAALRSLAAQIVDFVAPRTHASADPLAAMVGIDPEVQAPSDPALMRLLPDAYRDDPQAAGDFRRYTERSLRELKMAHARAVAASLEQSGEKVVLSDADIESWLGFLNDARLTIGTRIGISDDGDDLDGIDEDDPRFDWVQIYGWLTYLQDALLQAVMP